MSAWVLGLPGPNRAIVSLLGRKPDGKSEFRFYPFHGNWDSLEEREDKPSFQEWLDRNHADLTIIVKEHPTWDKGISGEEVEAANEPKTLTVLQSAGHNDTYAVIPSEFFVANKH